MNFFPFFILAAMLATIPVLQAEPAVVTARTRAREAMSAAEAKDYPAFLAKMTEAVALRPDYPRLLVNLAEAQTVNGQEAEAIATLERLAALGLNSPVDRASAFIPLRGRKDFQAVAARLEANLRPIGRGEVDFTLRDMTGLIEGMAWREKTREFFFGDVHLRTIWVRDAAGKVRRFSAPDETLGGVFGLVVDEARNTLWAATTAVSAMQGYTPELSGKAGIAEFELSSGQLRHTVYLPADGHDHVLGDLTLAPDGSLLSADSGAGVIWRFRPGADAMERFIESDEFVSLQGLVILPDNRTVFVADHANGLLRVDLDTQVVRRLETPPATTLIGLDGLVLAPDGDLIAVQNGLHPTRILRLHLDPEHTAIAQVIVLESAHLVMPEPALGCIASGDFVFIGNAGWSRFEGPEPKPTTPRPVPIIRTKL